MRQLPAMRFVLCEQDQEKYGKEDWVYDESAITHLSIGELVKIEKEIGMSIKSVMYRLRQDYVDASLAATWIARRMGGITERFADWTPLVSLISWEMVPAQGDATPLESSSNPEESPDS